MTEAASYHAQRDGSGLRTTPQRCAGSATPIRSDARTGFVLRQGMTAWMRAWAGCRRENQSEPSAPLAAGLLSFSVRTEMIQSWPG